MAVDLLRVADEGGLQSANIVTMVIGASAVSVELVDKLKHKIKTVSS